MQTSTEAQAPCLPVRLEWLHQQDPVTEAALDVRNVTNCSKVPLTAQKRKNVFQWNFKDYKMDFEVSGIMSKVFFYLTLLLNESTQIGVIQPKGTPYPSERE